MLNMMNMDSFLDLNQDLDKYAHICNLNEDPLLN